MILVDSRTGSAELAAPLKRLGFDVDTTMLEFGDVAFAGRGEHDAPVEIGIEFKKIDECLQSLRSGRLEGYQLPGLRKLYDWSWLLIEGDYRVDKDGLVCLKSRHRGWRPAHGKFTANEFEKRLLTLQLRGGLYVARSATRQDTLRTIGTLYRWWTDCALDAHSSHCTPYRPPAPVALSDFRETIRTLPQVGLRFSLAAQRQFKSIRRAINAGPREWAALIALDENNHTRRFGERNAQRVVDCIVEEHHD